jgi:hypothetical protein
MHCRCPLWVIATDAVDFADRLMSAFDLKVTEMPHGREVTLSAILDHVAQLRNALESHRFFKSDTP